MILFHDVIEIFDLANRDRGAVLFIVAFGFDHGVGHSLLLLYDAKAPLGKNSNYFNDLCHDLSNPSIGLF